MIIRPSAMPATCSGTQHEQERRRGGGTEQRDAGQRATASGRSVGPGWGPLGRAARGSLPGRQAAQHPDGQASVATPTTTSAPRSRAGRCQAGTSCRRSPAGVQREQDGLLDQRDDQSDHDQATRLGAQQDHRGVEHLTGREGRSGSTPAE